jgi:carbon-monoxide dehydrogenase small subunit
MKKSLAKLRVNGEVQEIHVEHNALLLNVLRDQLGLTGAKYGCGLGKCGACTVLLDGVPVNSCLILAVQASGKEITTVEGLAETDRLHPVQQAFVEHGAMQCGFCTPGMVLSAKSLLDRNPHPGEGEVREAIEGNLCRCTGYTKVVEAILSLSKERPGGDR